MVDARVNREWARYAQAKCMCTHGGNQRTALPGGNQEEGNGEAVGPAIHERGAGNPQSPEGAEGRNILDRKGTSRGEGRGILGWGTHRALGKGEKGRYFVGSGG